MICLRSTPAAYESVRAMLDSALGYPDIERRTLTAIPPSAELPSDDQGRVYLAVGSGVIPAEMLASAVMAGDGEQVSEDVFQAAFARFVDEAATL